MPKYQGFLRSQPLIAPSASPSEGSVMTRSASMNWVTPRPSQSGQAPSGLLNENERGVSSATDQPQTRQAKRVEKTMSSSVGGRSWYLMIY